MSINSEKLAEIREDVRRERMHQDVIDQIDAYEDYGELPEGFEVPDTSTVIDMGENFDWNKLFDDQESDKNLITGEEEDIKW